MHTGTYAYFKQCLQCVYSHKQVHQVSDEVSLSQQKVASQSLQRNQFPLDTFSHRKYTVLTKQLMHPQKSLLLLA